MTEVFGPIVTPPDVEEAVEQTLRAWMPTYLREFERRYGYTEKAFPNIRSWRPADNIEERLPEQQIPAVQIEMSTDVEITRRAETANGTFTGTVDVLVSTPQPESSRRMAAYYQFALGLILEQHPALDGSVEVGGFEWERMGAPAVAKPEGRWLALGSIAIVVEVLNIFDPTAGPVEPQEQEPPSYPTVATHHLIEVAA